MHWDIFGTVVSTVVAILMAAVLIGVAVRLLWERFSRVKTVRATVINKQTFMENRTDGRRMVERRRYVVTFLCGGKKMHFDVSLDTFSCVDIKQTGMLQYKGSKLLDFA